MPVYMGGQHDSPPPSPVCSDTLSLPDATSDLDVLSDCSGISVSDEDEKREEKRERTFTDSDTEILTDDDMEEITHSMLASSEIQHPPRRNQSTSTSSTHLTDHDRTPSATYYRGHRSSPSFHRGVGARDLEYPRLYQADLDSPFGLNSLYNNLKEERAIAYDPDVQSYSILDVQGESVRPKYERASQTELGTSTILDSEATLSQLSHTTAKESTSGPCTPLSSAIWLPGAEEGPTELDTIKDEATTGHQVNEDTASLLANWQRCGPRWLNRQTFGIFGVVLLSVAAYHVKSSTSWGSVDTNALFLNTTESLVSQTSNFVAMTNVPTTKHTPPAASTEIKESVDSTTILHLPAAPQSTERLVLSSFPSSVSALISRASSGIASLSTHVASVSSLSGHRSKEEEIARSIIASRRRRPRRKDTDLGEGTSKKAVQVVSSQVEAPGLSIHSATALSTLPKRAQRGLSILANRSLPCPGCTVTRGTDLKANKKKQASRRTGKHWIKSVETLTESSAGKKAEIVVNTSIEDASVAVAARNGFNAAFSRLTAHKYWLAMPYNSKVQRSESQSAPSIQPDDAHTPDPLLLENAAALSQLSFGNVCKQLDSLLLPYAQNAMDSLNNFNYDSAWRWLQSTMLECRQILAPYIATIDAYGKTPVRYVTEEARSITSTSMVKVDHMYSDVQAYIQRWQATYMPLVQHYVAAAQSTVKNTKHNVEDLSKATTHKVYGHSKSTFKKARHNARKLLNKHKGRPSRVQNNKQKHGNTSRQKSKARN